MGLRGSSAETNGGIRVRCSEVGQRLPNILTNMTCRWGAHNFDHAVNKLQLAVLLCFRASGSSKGATSEGKAHRRTGVDNFQSACWQKCYATLAGSNAESASSCENQKRSTCQILCPLPASGARAGCAGHVRTSASRLNYWRYWRLCFACLSYLVFASGASP